jgi:colanic acid/amylovoran biosynthesis glycosyltransferase
MLRKTNNRESQNQGSDFRKLRIAVVVNRFPKLSETFVLNHITALIKLGHEIDIFAFRKPLGYEKHHEGVMKYSLLDKTQYLSSIPSEKHERKKRALNIIVSNICKHPIWIAKCLILNILDKNRPLNNLFRTEPFLKKRYDVIHCHFGTNGNKIAILKDIFPKIKLFVTFHGFDIRLGLKKGGNLYKNLFRKANGIISVCEYNRQSLITLGCPKDKIIDLPNGVNLEKFKRTPCKSNGKFIITSVARLANSKNIHFALKLMKAIKDEQRYKFKYLILGDGYKREEVEKAVDDYNLHDQVVLLGATDHNGVIQILKDTNIFLLPSKKEAFPVVLLEAQAMGIPVVATNVGGVKEALLDGKTGYLVNVNDIQSTKSRIYTLFENSTLVEKMGNRGRRFIEENFDIKKLNKKLVHLYTAVS